MCNIGKKNARVCSEKTINNDYFRLKIGTVNKIKPEVIYFEGKTFIMPTDEDTTYSNRISLIKHNFSRNISYELKGNNLFDNKFIIDFQIANSGIRANKKSFLTFQVMLKQNSSSIKELKEVKELSTPFITKLLKELRDNIVDNDFVLSKTKN